MKLRKPFERLNMSNLQLGIWLIIIFTAARFILVLRANEVQSYASTWIIFAAMAVLTFVALKKEGLKEIGIRKPRNYMWLLTSFLTGAVAAALVYILFTLLFGHSLENSFVYIYRYARPEVPFTPEARIIMFAIFSVITMTFSPIGEELLYRGLIHQCFVPRFGETGASRIDSAAFAIAHLSHFGINYIAGNWRFDLFPAILWVICMYLTCRLFFICKSKSGSIAGAMLSHAGFNMATIYIVFYHIF